MAFLKNLNLGKLKEGVGAGVKSAQEGIANFDVNGAVKGAKDAVATGLSSISEKIEGTQNQDGQDGDGLSIKDFVAMMWFLSSTDGIVSPEEEQSIHSIASALDENYDDYACELRDECNQRLRAAAEDFGPENAAKIETQNTIDELALGTEDARLLCWNLLAVANSDGIEESELDFIRFVARKASVDQAVFEELRGYSDAIVEIELAQEQLKASNRSYAEVEPLMSEYTKRIQVIVDAAEALITDR